MIWKYIGAILGFLCLENGGVFSANAMECGDIFLNFKPAVVLIETYETNGSLTNPTRVQLKELGTGFFIHRDGYILTALHVIGTKDKWAKVGNKLKRQIAVLGVNKDNLLIPLEPDAQVLYYDEQLDVALLRIAKTNNMSVEIGDSSKLKAGEELCSIGFANKRQPAPHKNSVQLPSNLLYSGWMHLTKEGLGPGDSGGPVFNKDGQVVGWIVAGRGENLSDLYANSVTDKPAEIPFIDAFAVPINLAGNIIHMTEAPSTTKGEGLARGWLHYDGVQNLVKNKFLIEITRKAIGQYEILMPDSFSKGSAIPLVSSSEHHTLITNQGINKLLIHIKDGTNQYKDAEIFFVVLGYPD